MPSLKLSLLLLLFCSPPLFGDEKPSFMVGDCVIYEEGGEGRVLTSPRYWLRGEVKAVHFVRHALGVCPPSPRANERANMSRAAWVQYVRAWPCVSAEASVREVKKYWVEMKPLDWETPWTESARTFGRLFRGYFLEIPLGESDTVEIDARLLAHCAR